MFPLAIAKEPGATPTMEEGMPEAVAAGISLEGEVPVADISAEETAEEPLLEEMPLEETAAVGVAGADGAPSELVDVQYASSDAGTTVTLVGNQAFSDFEDFVLQDPHRLVVDLKSVTSSYAGDNTIPLGTPEIQQVRIGPGDGQTRIVMDLTSTENPAYTIDRTDTSLVVNVAASLGASEMEEEPLVEEPMVAGVAMVDEPDMEPVMDEPAPMVSSDPVQVIGLGFKQLNDQNRSRITIEMSEPVWGCLDKRHGRKRFCNRYS